MSLTPHPASVPQAGPSAHTQEPFLQGPRLWADCLARSPIKNKHTALPTAPLPPSLPPAEWAWPLGAQPGVGPAGASRAKERVWGDKEGGAGEGTWAPPCWAQPCSFVHSIHSLFKCPLIPLAACRGHDALKLPPAPERGAWGALLGQHIHPSTHSFIVQTPVNLPAQCPGPGWGRGVSEGPLQS